MQTTLDFSLKADFPSADTNQILKIQKLIAQYRGRIRSNDIRARKRVEAKIANAFKANIGCSAMSDPYFDAAVTEGIYMLPQPKPLDTKHDAARFVRYILNGDFD